VIELLTPDRFHDPGTAYAYQRTIFEQVAAGERPPTVSVTPSSLHVGVTRKDTLREGFGRAVREAHEEGYPVLVRGSGGGATAAGPGTFGFSVIRPSEDTRRGISERYDEAAGLVLGAFLRLGVDTAEVGEVRDEFCPGDHSIRVGSFESGMKLVGIAQRLTRRATSVGGIVLVWGETEFARVLGRVYDALGLPFRPGSVGSLHRTGSKARVEQAVGALAEEAKLRYGATPVRLDKRTQELARADSAKYLVRPFTC
jgi:octanoyl-[GcvH]:protein N-octanoyltransferase